MVTPAAQSRAVFISVGHGLAPRHALLLRQMNAYLALQSVTPLVIERRAQQISDPVDAIRRLVNASAGTIVLATARYAATDVVEYPGGENARALPMRITSTVWNQIEAAMTLQCQHPLLIVCEASLTPDGVIDPSIHPLVMFANEEIGEQLPASVEAALGDWLRRL